MRNPMLTFMVAFFITALSMGFVAGQFAPRVVGPWAVVVLLLGIVAIWVIALIQSYRSYQDAMKTKELIERARPHMRAGGPPAEPD